ncbi:MAG: hypothetical protein COA43_05070 [Robiginitomaculum sp.]|nr:MAG: hypothetical protein COA43_05070 [Robiginitomaculum sp.]
MFNEKFKNLGLILLSAIVFASLSCISGEATLLSAFYGGAIGLVIAFGFLATHRNFYAEICFLIGVVAGGTLATFSGMSFAPFVLFCIGGGVIGYLAPKWWDALALSYWF